MKTKTKPVLKAGDKVEIQYAYGMQALPGRIEEVQQHERLRIRLDNGTYAHGFWPFVQPLAN